MVDSDASDGGKVGHWNQANGIVDSGSLQQQMNRLRLSREPKNDISHRCQCSPTYAMGLIPRRLLASEINSLTKLNGSARNRPGCNVSFSKNKGAQKCGESGIGDLRRNAPLN